MAVEPTLEQAWQLLRQGKLADARSAFETVVSQNPVDAQGWHGQALTLHQLGEFAEARQAAETAHRLRPADSRCAYLCGYIAVDLNDGDAAVRYFSLAAELDNTWVAAHRSLGEALMTQGQATRAARAFEAAAALRPTDAQLQGALAWACWVAGEWGGARAAAEAADKLSEGQPLANLVLAKTALREGELPAALDRVRRCLRAAPGNADGWLFLLGLLRRQRDPDLWQAYENALQALPGHAPLWVGYADLQWESGDTVAAAQSFRRAEALDPGSLRAAAGSRLVLPQVYSSVEALRDSRARYEKGLDEIVSEDRRFLAPSAAGLSDASWTNFFLAYQGENDLALQSRYGDLLARVLAAREPRLCEPRPLRPGGGRLRVGFLSHFFFNCTAGRYFSSWVLDLDPAEFEVCVYYTNSWVSPDTEQIRRAASRFHHLADTPLHQVAKIVSEDALDVLVFPELGMHADTFVLAGLRLAPLQVAGWGHPTTTGLPTIDVYLSCSEMEPPEGASHYRESLRLLPGLGTRYGRPRTDSTRGRRDYRLPDEATLYLCPQSLFKIHPDNDTLLAQVLARDPAGRLVFFEGRNSRVTAEFRGRLERACLGVGVDPDSRLVQLSYVSHADYLRVNQLCDVMLDTLHWSGGNTALDALAMGLPVVTLPGSMMRGRQSLAMLRRLGLDDLIATDAPDYIRRASELGVDRPRRLALRSQMLERLGDLFEDPKPARELAAVLKSLVAERA